MIRCRWLGVDSFFIRENSETTSVGDTLRPYQTAGIVDYALAPGPKFPFQTNWYNECAKKAAVRHSWVAFIDLDEFMVILKKCVAPPATPFPSTTPPHLHMCMHVTCHKPRPGLRRCERR